jgi:hypothetical protein
LRGRSRAALLLPALTAVVAVATAAEPLYRLLAQGHRTLPCARFGRQRVFGASWRGRGAEFLEQPLHPVPRTAAALNRGYQTYRSAGLAVYGIGVDDEPKQSLEFARSVGVSFAMLLDPAKGASRSYEVDNLPMTVLIDRGGAIRYVLRDYSSANETLYLQELRALLNE